MYIQWLFIFPQWHKYFLKLKINLPTFAADLVADVKSVLKGNPVKFGSYPRSCKQYPNPLTGGYKEHFNLHNHCFKNGKVLKMCCKPEDLPGSINNI